MKKLLLISCLIMASATSVFADTTSVAINHFAVKENAFAKDEVAIVATDSLGNTRENVKGIFNFTVNGLEDTLQFTNGVAFYKHKLLRSTFLYVRHQNDSGTHSILYYVYRTDDKLTPVHIPWYLAGGHTLCAHFCWRYMFKRFIIVAIVIFCHLPVFFNYHNGLTIPAHFSRALSTG
jgi:hypothetical protein